MAVDLICPNCGDNLGKDTENSFFAYCGNCGEKDIINQRGDVDNFSPEQQERYNRMTKPFNKYY